jgi:type II secretory ATPase GspE/PulE/Tfp pilus assembly ATPase PilB-like protein
VAQARVTDATNKAADRAVLAALAEQAAEMVRQGKTSPAEVRRVLGSGMRT